MSASNPFYSFIPAFKQLLLSADATELSDKPYPVSYFETIRNQIDYSLRIYADLLHQTQQISKKPISQTCLFDYGAGNGLLGMFAKFVGYGKVILIERDSDFLEASIRLSQNIQLPVDDYLQDDLQDSINAFLKHVPDILVANDVIEHIYDLDCFFQKAKLLNPNLIFGFTTASNPLHPIKSRRIMNLQRKDEHEGSSDPFQNHPSFVSLRANIIRESLSEISAEEHAHWVRVTRGLNRKDIIKAIQQWKEKGIFPVDPEHPTNTCHPETGSWTERLLPLEVYADIAFRANLTVQISAGYYNTRHNFIRRPAAALANFIVRNSGNRWAPFLFLFFQPRV